MTSVTGNQVPTEPNEDRLCIVITGASGGVGAHLVEALSANARILALHRSHAPTGTMLAMAEWLEVDLTNMEHTARVADRVREIAGRVVLINCAGIARNGMVHRLSDEDWNMTLDTNLGAVFRLSKALLDVMRERRWGRIINFSSVVASRPVAGTAAYSASKAGLEALTRTLAIENAAKGVTANAIALGYLGVGMIREVPEGVLEGILRAIPVGALGDPRNVVEAVRFLIKSEYTTGSVLHINGGLY
jgi:NAD(P)-dependent dehydrogenase (short-subunit alcohol dehydrogenase family)